MKPHHSQARCAQRVTGAQISARGKQVDSIDPNVSSAAKAQLLQIYKTA